MGAGAVRDSRFPTHAPEKRRMDGAQGSGTAGPPFGSAQGRLSTPLRSAHEDSVPALLVVGVVRILVNGAAIAVEVDGAALGAHVDLELAGGAAALPAVVAVAQGVQFLA